MKRSLWSIAAVGLLIASACGSDGDSGSDTTAAAGTEAPAETEAPDTTAAAGTEAPASSEAPAGGLSNIQASGECGLGTGEAATGEPIKLGSIVTNVPGIDFRPIRDMASAYFDCVNENGGINGRPIEYVKEEEQIDAQQIASLATKLIEQDQVLGLVGNTSIIDCGVNGPYYAEQGYFAIIAGVDQACFTSANFSAVNMGPYYSSLGGAQAALRAGAEGTMVVVSPNQPGFDVINSGVVEFAEQNNMTGVSILEDVPVADPAGLAQRLVQEAGEGGGVVLDFTGPTVVPLLQAIDQQGLVDSVIWASSTPPNDPSVAAELERGVERQVPHQRRVQRARLGGARSEPHERGPGAVRGGHPGSSFSQMGYLAGRVATDALLGIEGEITKESVNEAFRSIKNFGSDIWCRPWYFESTVGSNVSNNVDLTVAPENGNMVQVEDCFDIAELPSNPLAEIRAAEQELGLNAG